MIPLRRILSILDGPDRRRAAFILLLAVVGAVLETVGIGLILPFISIVSDPSVVETNGILRGLRDFLGSDSSNSFLLACGFILLAFYILKNAYLTLACYLQSRFIYGRMRVLSVRLLDAYLNAPYRFHLTRNSSDLQRNLNIDVPHVFTWVVAQSFLVVGDTLVVLVLTALLLTIDPLATLAALFVFCVAGGTFFVIVRSRTRELGKREQASVGRMIRWVNQGLGSLKETKILGVEPYFREAYAANCREYTRARRVLTLLGELPRLVFEALAVGGILLILLVSLAGGREMEAVVPMLAVFAAAAFRLLPAMSRILRATNMVRHFRPTLEVVAGDLELLQAGGIRDRAEPTDPPRMEFAERIRFENVRFSYSEDSGEVVRGLEFEIRPRESIGIVGRSGSGKTTVVDLLLGLLPPDAGRITIDGRDLQEAPAGWQRNVGYIPQTIYLTDDTIRRNVAFGVPDPEIDEAAVRRALRAASLEEFVDGLPEGLEHEVGEIGVRLSGGQRQRIGIARALYRDPAVLVLDEATSALDPRTEEEVSATIAGLAAERTVVLIAHRQTTVRKCDRLLFLADGRLAGEGTYDELSAESEAFRAMTGIES